MYLKNNLLAESGETKTDELNPQYDFFVSPKLRTGMSYFITISLNWSCKSNKLGESEKIKDIYIHILNMLKQNINVLIYSEIILIFIINLFTL